MKLDYGTLLSFDPLPLQCGCSIISPTLKEISKIGFQTYNSYLSLMILNLDNYFQAITNESEYFSRYEKEEKDIILKIKNEYNSLSDAQKEEITLLDILSFDKQMMKNIVEALAFFLCCKLDYSFDNRVFIIKNNGQDDEAFPHYLYQSIAELILQRNGITQRTQDEKPKFKNKLAEKLYYRSMQAENNFNRDKNIDSNMELPNIISAVAAYHHSINMINIWDMTVYQLYDQFQRLQNNNVYRIQSISVATWGDEKNKFDATQWFKNLNNQ